MGEIKYSNYSFFIFLVGCFFSCSLLGFFGLSTKRIFNYFFILFWEVLISQYSVLFHFSCFSFISNVKITFVLKIFGFVWSTDSFMSIKITLLFIFEFLQLFWRATESFFDLRSSFMEF